MIKRKNKCLTLLRNECYTVRLVVARIYIKGDKDSIKKQNVEFLLKINIFFLANGRYEFIHTLSNIWVGLLDLVKYSKKIKFLLLLSMSKNK